VQRPRVLVIDEEVPWPANTGKRIRTLNLLTALADHFAIDVLTHANETPREAVDEMTRRGMTVHLAPGGVAAKKGLLFPIRVATSVARRLPYSVHAHDRRPFRQALQRLLRQHRYQLVHCEWTPYALYARGLDVPVCIAAHNLEWIIWRRLSDAESRAPLKALFRVQAALMERFEKRVFEEFGSATAVSEPDAELIRRMGCRQVVVVPNGVDVDAYDPRPEQTPEPRTLVFAGSLDWRPNQDAIRWFIDAVHPVLSARTAYRFWIVGRTPPDWLTRDGAVPPEITVVGEVDDVRPWIARAAVSVVPLRVGGGSRLKILEALAMGRAVVSTTVGAEGLDLEPGAELLLADAADAFAAAIADLFNDDARRRRLGSAGRQRVETSYRWDRIANIQRSLWNDIIRSRPPQSSRGARAPARR